MEAVLPHDKHTAAPLALGWVLAEQGSTARATGDGQSPLGSAHGPLQYVPESTNYFCLVSNSPRTLFSPVPGPPMLWPNHLSFTPKHP